MQIKRKIPAFVFGVSIGLIIGIGFFIFKLDDYFNKMKSATSDQIKIIEQPVKPEEQEKKAAEEKSRFKINTKVSPVTNYKEVDSLIKEDPAINLATEELISVKSIKLIDLDAVSKDTLAANLAGVNHVSSNDIFFVEFRKTPLNSKGYRMAKNRIMLYGFSDFSSFNIYKVDDVYYLKSEEQVYRVTINADFMPMERVQNSDLLARIN